MHTEGATSALLIREKLVQQDIDNTDYPSMHYVTLPQQSNRKFRDSTSDVEVEQVEQSLTPHPTQYRSFRRRSSQPIT